MRSGRKPSLTADAVRALREKFRERRTTGSRTRWIKQEATRLEVTPLTIENAIRGRSYRWVR